MHLGADEVGRNESLIARALASYGADTSEVVVATKSGHLHPADRSWTVNASPDYLRRACEPELGATDQSFDQVALDVEASPQQVTLAWMLALSPVVIPIPGSAGAKPSGPLLPWSTFGSASSSSAG